MKSRCDKRNERSVDARTACGLEGGHSVNENEMDCRGGLTGCSDVGCGRVDH